MKGSLIVTYSTQEKEFKKIKNRQNFLHKCTFCLFLKNWVIDCQKQQIKKPITTTKNPVGSMTLKMSPSAEVNIGNQRSAWDDL